MPSWHSDVCIWKYVFPFTVFKKMMFFLKTMILYIIWYILQLTKNRYDLLKQLLTQVLLSFIYN